MDLWKSITSPSSAVLEPTVYALGRKTRDIGLGMIGQNPEKIAFENAQKAKDKIKDDLLKKYNLQQLNEMMHEERTTKIFN